MSFAFGLALILIYLILAAQFESFIDPLIIMITVPRLWQVLYCHSGYL
ncbi:MAG: efflux RND transporter permease subunit [Bacteroidia bacterium]